MLLLVTFLRLFPARSKVKIKLKKIERARFGVFFQEFFSKTYPAVVVGVCLGFVFLATDWGIETTRTRQLLMGVWMSLHLTDVMDRTGLPTFEPVELFPSSFELESDDDEDADAADGEEYDTRSMYSAAIQKCRSSALPAVLKNVLDEDLSWLMHCSNMSDRNLCLILGSVVDKDLTPEPIGGGDLLELFIAAYNPYTDREWTPSPEQREQIANSVFVFGDNTTDEDVVVEFWGSVWHKYFTRLARLLCGLQSTVVNAPPDMRVGSILCQ